MEVLCSLKLSKEKNQIGNASGKKSQRTESKEDVVKLCYIVPTNVRSEDIFDPDLNTKVAHTLSKASISIVANAGVGEFMHIDNTLDHGYVECVSLGGIEGKFINGLISLALQKKEALGDKNDDSFVMDEYGRYRYALHELSADKIVNCKPFITSTKVKYSDNDSNSTGNFIENTSLKQLH